MFAKTALFILLLSCAACGPKEIGYGSADDARNPPEPNGAEMLRLPMTGMSNVQHMLYWQNRPDVMANIQKSHSARLYRALGISPENPAWREIPAQKSPFRQ